jgi:hypothetical protein
VRPGTRDVLSFVDLGVVGYGLRPVLYAVAQDAHVYAFDERGVPMPPENR